MAGVATDVGVRRPDHHGVPAEGHENAETVIVRAVAGGQFFHKAPVVIPALVSIKDVGRALIGVAADVGQIRPDHHGVPAEGHGNAEIVTSRAVAGGQFFHFAERGGNGQGGVPLERQAVGLHRLGRCAGDGADAFLNGGPIRSGEALRRVWAARLRWSKLCRQRGAEVRGRAIEADPHGMLDVGRRRRREERQS